MAGSMRERQPGVWELRVSAGFDPVTGKRLQRSVTVRGSKRGAERELARLITEVEDAQTPRVERSVTLNDLLRDYLDRWDGSPTTLVSYRSLVRNHIEPTLGRKQLRRIDARLLDDYYRHLATDKGLSPNVIRKVHAVLQGAFRVAVRWGWLKVNPARDIDLPQIHRKDLHLPGAEQLTTAITTAKAADPVTGMAFHLTAATGARRSEICGLRWRHLDVGTETLRIEAAVVSVAGVPTEKNTKNHTRRKVALDRDTLAALAQHREAMEARARACGARIDADSFMFSNEADCAKPLHPDNLTARWELACKRAGISGVRLHDLRHFQATMLLAAGVPLKNVSARIGHKDATTTLNIYTHLLEETDRDAAELIGRLLDHGQNRPDDRDRSER